ncbi:hypothetical protein [Thalassotalea atypica]|uniref:hypothetical protein n=1 Tax=Thalassotalea atypica TaxID=2054316 RepID=UPI0025725788|nr:hypothetical protein [Thalassotalea atypica]
MDKHDVFILARTLHIFAIVIWIGGVAFVTTILIPALKTQIDQSKRMDLFELLEGKFAVQAKVVSLLAGASGFFMLDYMDGWYRFYLFQYWWLHAMVLIWLVFTIVLFVLEPLFLHRWFKKQAELKSRATFNKIHVMHKVLLTLSIFTVLGAAAGSHGLLF